MKAKASDLVQRKKEDLRQVDEQRSNIEPLRRTSKSFDKDPNLNTEFWLKDTTPEEEQENPGLGALREQLARELIDIAASTDLRGTARRLFQQTITNRKNAGERRSPFTALLSSCQQEVLRKNLKPSLRTILDELKSKVAPCGIIRAIDEKNKTVRWAVSAQDWHSTRYSSISRWVTENKPK